MGDFSFRLSKLICLFFLLFIGFVVKGQNSNFINYGVEDGLIMSQIETVVQDNKGNLWIGTIGGLSKYNGVSFINYTQKDSLAEDWITCSFKDKDGDIWFGHWGGGVTVWDSKKEVFIDKKLENQSKFKLITSICQDKNGVVWFLTESAELFSFNKDDNSSAIYELGNNTTKG